MGPNIDSSRDQLLYYHSLALDIVNATEIKEGSKIHKISNRAGDVFEAIGGICQLSSSDSLELLSAMGMPFKNAGEVHGWLSAFAENMSLLTNARNLTAS